MNAPARDLRASALQRLIKGEITQAEYDQLLARIDEMYAPPPRVQEPVYMPTFEDREQIRELYARYANT